MLGWGGAAGGWRGLAALQDCAASGRELKGPKDLWERFTVAP